MALVLDIQPMMVLPPHPRPMRALLQWMPGDGPIPRMYDDNHDIIGSLRAREMGDNAMGWVPIKNAHGWNIFDEVKS
jgi:hypothetical protein